MVVVVVGTAADVYCVGVSAAVGLVVFAATAGLYGAAASAGGGGGGGGDGISNLCFHDGCWWCWWCWWCWCSGFHFVSLVVVVIGFIVNNFTLTITIIDYSA